MAKKRDCVGAARVGLKLTGRCSKSPTNQKLLINSKRNAMQCNTMQSLKLCTKVSGAQSVVEALTANLLSDLISVMSSYYPSLCHALLCTALLFHTLALCSPSSFFWLPLCQAHCANHFELHCTLQFTIQSPPKQNVHCTNHFELCYTMQFTIQPYSLMCSLMSCPTRAFMHKRDILFWPIQWNILIYKPLWITLHNTVYFTALPSHSSLRSQYSTVQYNTIQFTIQPSPPTHWCAV